VDLSAASLFLRLHAIVRNDCRSELLKYYVLELEWQRTDTIDQIAVASFIVESADASITYLLASETYLRYDAKLTDEFEEP
jgi:hypothetical protein